MRSVTPILLTLSFVACGGGGGGGGGGEPPTPPATPTAVIAATAVVMAPSQTIADLTVSLLQSPTSAPVLLEAHVDLPPQLTLPIASRLAAAVPLANLDGDFVQDSFVILCGDNANPNAQQLPVGPLFHLRISPSEPRLPGTYTVTLHSLLAATSEGEAVPLASESIAVTVSIQ